jgi:hypothetical protein
MQKSVRANLELGVNIVIAVCLLVVVGVVVKRYFFPERVDSESLTQQSKKLLGTRISVPNINWAENKKSLIFFLNKDCIYCKSSAPFYRELIHDASKRDVKLLAILPNSVEEARAYLRSLELPIENVQSAPPSSYQIHGTPSVLFVDNAGNIKGVWLGAAPDREKQMRDELIALFDEQVVSGFR